MAYLSLQIEAVAVLTFSVRRWRCLGHVELVSQWPNGSSLWRICSSLQTSSRKFFCISNDPVKLKLISVLGLVCEKCFGKINFFHLTNNNVCINPFLLPGAPRWLHAKQFSTFLPSCRDPTMSVFICACTHVYMFFSKCKGFVYVPFVLF